MTEIKTTANNLKHLPSEALAEELKNLHFADSIDIINDLNIMERVTILSLLPLDYAIELFDKPELEKPAAILELLPVNLAVEILDGMSADAAADVFQEIDKATRTRLYALLKPLTRTELKKLTSYPDHTAGALMTTEFIAVPANWTVKKTLDHIRDVERTRETVYTSYVIDPKTSTLLKAVSLRNLILASPDDKILNVSTHDTPITISPFTHHEDIARLFQRHDLLSVPVIDDSNHVIGIVTVDDVLDSMVDEMNEDAYKFGGLEALDKPYMQINFFGMMKKRGGWLALLFMGEMLTASAMQYFETELEKVIALTLFIPLIMSSGGNSGSQATSLIIRALALRELTLKDWWKVIIREIPTGISLGILLGIIGITRIAVWQQLGIYNYGEYWFFIAITVGAALVGIVTFGSLAGSMLPFILKRLQFDPASASAPFVATLVDVMGIIIYFSVASFVLSGILL
ncbi:Mg2+ transport protein [Bartonella clarridgeiae 73]|uniref:Magnesium transporter MgtE n=1 Tax=Bartonella clarridgeiae (strain CCUG 45776 / CIP 104772 / 73) TaxID=696125 RepID=E6YIU2_BARC7|nr:magnesium transporter [Bartonella clarridgeiae]WCR54655.1 MAG: Mg/Co/Ni transporter MgtE CBS domain-containing [Bartonella clarridgeiae]CBI76780.1 Mg2+ transport protein [Bartonella clarridgeiae 73]